jgi:hypothetical protein
VPRAQKTNLLFSGLGPAGKTKERGAERDALLKHWGAHPWNWLRGVDVDGRPIIWTKLEGSKGQELPEQPFPDLPHLRALVDILYDPRQGITLDDGTWVEVDAFVALDKCRQMMVSTVIILLMDWWCRFRRGRRFIVSKVKEEDAAELINDKARYIELGLPQWVRDAVPQESTPRNIINYPRNAQGGGSSVILAVAQNAHEGTLRGGTATAVLIDEAAFVDMTSELIAAARPMGGRIWMVSSPYLGTRGGVTFRNIITQDLHPGDAMDGRDHEGVQIMPGMRLRRTSKGWSVISLDHYADPRKDDVWAEKEAKGYDDHRQYLREIKRDWGSAAGTPFYPQWAYHGGRATHVRSAPGLLAGMPIVRGWDFGQRNPACVWMQYDPERRRLWYLRELSLQGLSTHTFRDLVLFYSGQLAEDQMTGTVRQWVQSLTSLPNDARFRDPFFRGTPRAPIRFLDWSGHEALQERAEVAEDSDERTSARILDARGIDLQIQYGAVTSGHQIVRELMAERPDGWPGLLCDPYCALLVDGFDGQLTYKKGTPGNPAPEEIQKDQIYSHVHEAALYPVPSLVGLEQEKALRLGNVLTAEPLPLEELRAEDLSLGWSAYR